MGPKMVDFKSPGMWCLSHASIDTSVSEEHATSIFNVEDKFTVDIITKIQGVTPRIL